MKLKISSLIVISLLLFPLTAGAERAEFGYVDNSGGLNTKASHFALSNNETSDSLNVFYGTDGSIKKRKGFDKLYVTAITGTPNVTGQHLFTKIDGTDYIVTTAGAKVYSSDTVMTTLADITGAATITADKYFDFETFMNTCIFTNGEDVPLKWSGTGNVAALDVPSGLTEAKWVVRYSNYLFLGNVTVSGTAYPSRLYYCAQKDITSWNSLDYVDISKDDGEKITGLVVLGDKLIVFKEYSAYLIMYTGDSDLPFLWAGTPGKGCISGYSIQPLGTGVVALSYDGLYLFDGLYSLKVSKKIDPTIDGYTQGSFNVAHAAIFSKLNQYWITFTASGSANNDEIIVYDYANDAFSRYDGIAASTLMSFYDDGIEKLYFGGYNGFCYRLERGYADDTVAIDAYQWTKWYDFDTIVYNKKVLKGYVALKDVGNYDLEVGYNYDHQTGIAKTLTINMSSGGSVVGTAIVGTAVAGGSGGIISRMDLTGQGRVFRMRYGNDNINENFDIRGFGYLVEKGSIR